ncbi:OsmC family peroxiredoxin [Bizionia gelidisalsuginis]|uniref:OsmC family peroxiredoxin n=2 Tax=Bizionia TaxID=283785 RepID=A0A8H2QJV9_9FLAO|nr:MULTISPECIES: OsmC family protein [Bizionia]TYB76678.1 OsmC family peroxiredoxin [Bizionia saleffrena]TYC14129.1 OsmC family peroxiredoxin [Bizionia gelidisalsuginis]
MEQHSYNVTITWTEDRKGLICSPELLNTETKDKKCIEVATPPEFPGGMPNIWSPEHLFTAAVSSCLMTTFLAIADFSKLEYVSFKCNSKGILEKVDGKLVISEVLLFPEVVITDASKRDRTERIVEKAEKACLISNSITAKVTMETKIIIQN